MKSIDGHHFLISLHQLSEDLKQISQIKASSLKSKQILPLY